MMVRKGYHLLSLQTGPSADQVSLGRQKRHQIKKGESWILTSAESLVSRVWADYLISLKPHFLPLSKEKDRIISKVLLVLEL